MLKHTEILEEIWRAIRTVGRSNTPSIAGFEDLRESAQNCSEMRVWSDEGRSYIVSVIEEEDDS